MRERDVHRSLKMNFKSKVMRERDVHRSLKMNFKSKVMRERCTQILEDELQE